MSKARSAIAIVLAFIVNSAAAIPIDTTGSDTGNVIAFGVPNTATYGQTFTVVGPEAYLEDFSLFLRHRAGGSGPLNLRGYIGTWTGLRAGSLLYSSPTETMNAAGTEQQFLFDTELQLTPGQYVAFLSVSELDGQAPSLFGMPRGGDSIPGLFVHLNNGADETQWTTSTWFQNHIRQSDVFFTATLVAAPAAGAVDAFDAVNAVPEPGSLALLSIALAAFGLSRRRKKA